MFFSESLSAATTYENNWLFQANTLVLHVKLNLIKIQSEQKTMIFYVYYVCAFLATNVNKFIEYFIQYCLSLSVYLLVAAECLFITYISISSRVCTFIWWINCIKNKAITERRTFFTPPFALLFGLPIVTMIISCCWSTLFYSLT